MNYLESVVVLGFIFSLQSLAVLISFRIFSFADITTDGSLTLGAAGATLLMIEGTHPALAMAAGFSLGSIGGVLTAVLYTRYNINGLLAGMLVIPTLYSLTYRMTGEDHIDLPEECTLEYQALRLAGWFGKSDAIPAMFVLLSVLGGLTAVVVAALAWFFQTRIGTAMRATGDNPAMVRAYGIDVSMMTIFGLAMANALAGLAGALLVAYYGRFHLQLGVGMIVWGLAGVMIGENLLPGKQVVRMLIRTVLGAVVYRCILEAVLLTGLHPSDLKFVSAMFVLVALIWPQLKQQLRWHGGAGRART